MAFFVLTATVISLALSTICAVPTTSHPRFPQVNLGYAVHAPTYINTTVSPNDNLTYATYANIRFAEPPKGDLRFRAPKTPPPKQNAVQNGSYPFGATDCLNAFPKGFSFGGVDLGGSSWGSEDCLFLDVKVPEGAVKKGKKLPVLHWFYGGGYFIGSKSWSGDPASLFYDASPDEEFIVVVSNYRLGVAGWVSAPGEDMTPNVGLWDAQAALEWTQKYIHKFGGDPNRITVMGESAGGAIIQHLITSRGGKGKPAPFKQAFTASPGARPLINTGTRMKALHKSFLESANCASTACLRAVPESVIAEANRRMIVDLPTNGWVGPGIGFSIILDGDLVPDVTDRLLDQGRYHKNVEKIVSSNMLDDGKYSTTTPASTWSDFLKFFMQTPTASTVSAVSAQYPNNSFDAFAKDAIFQCHAYNLARVFGPRAHRYVMTIPPATHAQDQSYYFYVNNATTPVSQAGVARGLQRYLRRLVVDEGEVNEEVDGGGEAGAKQSYWPAYGNKGERNVLSVETGGFQAAKEKEDAIRGCDLLARIVHDGANGF